MSALNVKEKNCWKTTIYILLSFGSNISNKFKSTATEVSVY